MNIIYIVDMNQIYSDQNHLTNKIGFISGSGCENYLRLIQADKKILSYFAQCTHCRLEVFK